MFYAKIEDLQGKSKYLYYPADSKYAIYDTSLELSVGECGTFTFRVPYTNLSYKLLEEQKIVTIYKNDTEYWRGWIKELNTGLDKSVEVYCVEDMGWLAYDCVEPTSETVTKSQKLQQIVETYNRQIGVKDTAKEFSVGYVTSDITRKYQTTYEESLLDNLRTLAGDNNYVRVRRENGNRYIDIVTLDSYGNNSRQKIRLGENLLDYVKEITTSYMLNVIYPYGAEIEGEEVYEGLAKRLVGTPLRNDESIAKYGRIAKNVLFNTTDPETLQAQAEAYLNQNKNPRVALEISAVDLAELGANTESINLGDKVELQAEALGIDSIMLPVTKMTIDLQRLDNNRLTMSTTVTNKTLTEQYTAIEAELQSIPTTDSVLDSAKRNVINLLNGADGGYVVEKVNAQGQRQELWITDNIDKDKASKKWVWNENGLGYMYKDVYGEWTTDVALTMDGEILAKRGVIGSDSEAWDIGAHSIYNGTTSPTDYDREGLYVGTDGILNVAEGTAGEMVYTKIQGGKIKSTSSVEASSVKAGVLTTNNINGGGEYVYTNKLSVSDALIGRFVDGNGNTFGHTGTFTAVSTMGSIRVTVVNGLITKIESL